MLKRVMQHDEVPFPLDFIQSLFANHGILGVRIDTDRRAESHHPHVPHQESRAAPDVQNARGSARTNFRHGADVRPPRRRGNQVLDNRTVSQMSAVMYFSQYLLEPGRVQLAPGQVAGGIVSGKILWNLFQEQTAAIAAFYISKRISKTEHHLADLVRAIARLIPAYLTNHRLMAASDGKRDNCTTFTAAARSPRCTQVKARMVASVA